MGTTMEFDYELDLGAESFTYCGFRQLINRLRIRGYSFAAFNEAPQLMCRGERFVLMRHDIDMCLSKALAMAE